jgi:hypothetical protein
MPAEPRPTTRESVPPAEPADGDTPADHSDRYTLFLWLGCMAVMWLLGLAGFLRWLWH